MNDPILNTPTTVGIAPTPVQLTTVVASTTNAAKAAQKNGAIKKHWLDEWVKLAEKQLLEWRLRHVLIVSVLLGLAMIIVAETIREAVVLPRLALPVHSPWLGPLGIGLGVLAEIGKALLSGAFLAGTVDLVVKSRLVREVVNDVATHMRTAHLPANIRQTLDELGGTKVARTKYTSVFKMRFCPNRRVITLNHRAEWFIQNFGDSLEHCHQTMTLPRRPGTPDSGRIICALAKGVFDGDDKPADYDLVESEIREEITRSPDWIRWVRSFYIRPKKRAAEAAEFFSETEIELPDEWLEPITFLLPTCDVRVEIDHPPGLEVRVEFGHPSLREVMPSRRGPLRLWEGKEVFLPFTGFEVSWNLTSEELAKREASNAEAVKRHEVDILA